jgi:hypothetical protein
VAVLGDGLEDSAVLFGGKGGLGEDKSVELGRFRVGEDEGFDLVEDVLLGLRNGCRRASMSERITGEQRGSTQGKTG